MAQAGWLGLLAGAAVLGPGPRRRLAAAGLILLGLGLAAWRVGTGGGADQLAGTSTLPRGFAVVNGGILLLGLGCGALALLLPGRGEWGRPRTAAPIIPGLLLTGAAALPLVAIAGLPAAGAAVLLGLAGVLLLAAGKLLPIGRAMEWLDRRGWGPPARLPPSPISRPALWLFAGGTLAAAFGPDVASVFGGFVLATGAFFVLVHPPAARPVPLAPLLSLVLAPVYWLTATVAGSTRVWVGSLPMVPFSPAAESLVAPGLLVALWASAGLWPLHRQVPGALLAPLGALLVIRVGLPAVPLGLEHWRPAAVPLVVLGIWHAAWIGRGPLLAAAAAVLGLLSQPAGSVGAIVALLAAAAGLELSATAAAPGLRVTRVLLVIVGGWGGLAVVEAGLRTETVYTAVGVAGVALAFASRDRSQATAAAPATYRSPST